MNTYSTSSLASIRILKHTLEAMFFLESTASTYVRSVKIQRCFIDITKYANRINLTTNIDIYIYTVIYLFYL